MNEFLYFTCPEVKIWYFSSFSKTFKKLGKIEVFANRRPVDILAQSPHVHICQVGYESHGRAAEPSRKSRAWYSVFLNLFKQVQDTYTF